MTKNPIKLRDIRIVIILGVAAYACSKETILFIDYEKEETTEVAIEDKTESETESVTISCTNPLEYEDDLVLVEF
jgi:hypothetical protein